ncbi:MAG: hypothetical protein PHY16_18740 [Methylobacter sp.]|nr:hypothetical protein [Methylobacter sp.]
MKTLNLQNENITHDANKVGNNILQMTKIAKWEKHRLIELIDNKNMEILENDANEALDFIAERLAFLKQQSVDTARCKLKLRMGLYVIKKGGYKKLGFESFKACLEDKFFENKNLSTLYREAEAARLEILLFRTRELERSENQF